MARPQRLPAGVTKMANGRYRAIIVDPATGKNTSVATVLGIKGTTWPTPEDAGDARKRAHERLHAASATGITIRQFWDDWINGGTFTTFPDGDARRTESTMITLEAATKHFVAAYGELPLRSLDEPSMKGAGTLGDDVIAEWVKGGRRGHTLSPLSSMFNDARSLQGGRLIKSNPLAGRHRPKNKGRSEDAPPSEAQMEDMLRLAYELTPPAFAAYLEFGCLTACRPGEIDGLPWTAIRFEDKLIDIAQQYNKRVQKITAPKWGSVRTIAMVGRTEELLRDRLAQRTPGCPWVFETAQRNHFTATTRDYHWNRVRCAAGLGKMPLYLATRHYAGYYMLNKLKLAPWLIAREFGHSDNGELILKLYGHVDPAVAAAMVREAWTAHNTPEPTPTPAGIVNLADRRRVA